MTHILRVLGIKNRTKAVTLDSVEAAKMNPKDVAESRRSTANLVGAIMQVERSSWEIRKLLASGALDFVVDADRPADEYRRRPE